ncbi:MAG: hypothetical protein U0270_01520 [Labilithrix sp.]
MAGIVALTIAAVVQLVRHVPTVQTLPMWFWNLHDKATSWFWFALLALGLAATLAQATRSPARRASRVVLPIFLLGVLLQLGMGWSEGRGVRGLRDRYLHSGHTQFAHVATFEPDLFGVLRHYEAFTKAHDLVFLRSKPPGTLLAYVVVDRLSRVVPASMTSQDPEPDVPEKLLRAANLASLVFPLVSLALLFPLFAISRRLMPKEIAWWPLLLLVLAPPLELITLHIDQVLCPLLEVGLGMAVVAGLDTRSERERILWAGAAGALAWLSLFVSFALIPGVALVAGFGALDVALGKNGSAREKALRVARMAGVALGVFLVLTLLAHLLIGYSATVRFRDAMGNHERFKQWSSATNVVLESALLDIVEFSYILGVPIMGAFLWQTAGAVERTIRRTESSLDRFTLATAVILTLLPFTSKTQAETARLWLFLVPCVALGAAAAIQHAFPRPRQGFIALSCCAALQLVWMMTVKRYCDFY